MKQPKLLQQVADATGLPDDLVLKELRRLTEEAGMDEQKMSLDDLRRLMVDYLQEVILEAKDNLKN